MLDFTGFGSTPTQGVSSQHFAKLNNPWLTRDAT
jgi:hypothetical protein